MTHLFLYSTSSCAKEFIVFICVSSPPLGRGHHEPRKGPLDELWLCTRVSQQSSISIISLDAQVLTLSTIFLNFSEVFLLLIASYHEVFKVQTNDAEVLLLSNGPGSIMFFYVLAVCMGSWGLRNHIQRKALEVLWNGQEIGIMGYHAALPRAVESVLIEAILVIPEVDVSYLMYITNSCSKVVFLSSFAWLSLITSTGCICWWLC